MIFPHVLKINHSFCLAGMHWNNNFFGGWDHLREKLGLGSCSKNSLEFILFLMEFKVDFYIFLDSSFLSIRIQ